MFSLLLLFAVAPPEAGSADQHPHVHRHEPNPVREVQDTTHWEFFEFFFPDKTVGWHIPPIDLGFFKFQPTKYMVLELIAALLIILIYVPLARRISSGDLPRGRFWNFFEGVLTFIRDEIARPNLDSAKHEDDHGHSAESGHAPAAAHSHALELEQAGHGHGHDHHHHEEMEEHSADKYVPFLWTLFLFVLFCNLLGMLPLMGSPTASIWVTGALALISFVMMHGVVIAKHGWKKYLQSLWPALEMPPGAAFAVMGFMITALLAFIEFVGGFIKSGVLAVRLFANMFAGHLVLANILFFIFAVGKAFGPGPLWGGVTVASVLGVVALSLLELFVAFLQAYIFTFLTALFMGMALQHAEHH